MEDNGSKMSIYVTGDMHGERSRVVQIDKELNMGDYLIVCGDWGYIFHNTFEERRFLEDLEARPYTILFVDGNHENFAALYEYPEEEWNGGKIHRIKKNIIHLCRGQVFQIEGLKFFAFGGGYSLDRASRIPGVSWWKEELPDLTEYEEGKKNLERHGWSVDYILTHTVNAESIKVLAALDRYSEIKPFSTDEAPLNFYLEEIRDMVEYKQWFFGHFHRDKSIPYTRQRALWFDIVKLN